MNPIYICTMIGSPIETRGIFNFFSQQSCFYNYFERYSGVWLDRGIRLKTSKKEKIFVDYTEENVHSDHHMEIPKVNRQKRISTCWKNDAKKLLDKCHYVFKANS